MARRAFLVLGICLVAVACGLPACDCGGGGQDDPWEDCIDNDGDDYGEGCMLGPDCDDDDPALNFSCDCAVVPRQGCECTGTDVIPCFEAAAAALDHIPCREGQRRCVDGSFGVCEGQVLPMAETCDLVDNDCDGQTDQGLECTGCGVGCFEEKVGPDTPNGFELDDQNGRGLKTDPDGNIILDDTGGQHIELGFLWVANAAEGTVSKVNTRTGAEEGRYVSALTTPGDPRNRATAPQGAANSPSRTAVDFNGDVWVANRSFSGQGSVTKIAHQNCIDVNGDGQIQTSHDVNGNGSIELSDPQEYLDDSDECILFTVNVGGFAAVPRALALDAGSPDSGAGNAWVGCYSEQKIYKLNADDGRVLVEVNVPLSPYGAAIDSTGLLWTTQESTGWLAYVDTNTNTASGLIQLAGFNGSYGIAVDGANRVWVGGYGLEGAARYDPATGGTMVVATPGVGVGRGIAADADGNIWLAHSWDTDSNYVGRLTRFRADDGGAMQTYEFPGGLSTIGVGMDFDGNAWGVNQETNNACRVTPSSGAIQCFPVGSGPYTYSDFTGFALRTFTAPRGTYKQLFEGCRLDVGTYWKELTWDANVPAGTTLTVYVRAADTIEGLATAPRQGPFTTSPVDLAALGITGHYLLVEFELASDVEGSTPILRGISAQWFCGGET